MDAPVVFISYSHDSESHKSWVLKLATDLRKNGIDAILDQWDLSLGQDMAMFMQKGVTESDRVLMVCSADYVRKADDGAGGVGYERLIVTTEVVQNIDTKKFIPVVRNNAAALKVPKCIGPRFYIDCSDDSRYEDKLQDLLREIHGVPASAKPALGSSPFSSITPSVVAPMRIAGPTGATAGGRVLDEKWFQDQSTRAVAGASKLGIAAYMELRYALHDPINKSQIELLNSEQKSQIKTFGWPIGVTLDGRPEFKPRALKDGISTEIALEKEAMTGRTSYDFWSLRNNGDFYLLQNLFEDMRDTNKVFFNTRIVRVTEALLFADNLYTNLGVPPGARISFRVKHAGLSGRTLGSASFNRIILPATAHENDSEVEIVVIVGSVRQTLAANVQSLLGPMFLLFDFREFSEKVYGDIVNRFAMGEAT